MLIPLSFEISPGSILRVDEAAISTGIFNKDVGRRQYTPNSKRSSATNRDLWICILVLGTRRMMNKINSSSNINRSAPSVTHKGNDRVQAL
jgi:hypothetical protein